jgi:hypothetical protein
VLHWRVCPDPRIVGGPLPVSIEVEDEPFVIAHDLAVDGVVHLATPEILLNSIVWYFARRILKLDDSAIHAESKTGQVIPALQAPGSCLTLFIRRHPDHLPLQVC